MRGNGFRLINNMERIRISVQDTADSLATVRVDGVIDTITAPEVDKAVMSATGRGRHKLVIDLGGVDYISSAGWGVFISHLKETRQRQGDVRLCGMIPNVREIYELLEFDSVLSAFPNSTQATASFENQLLAPPSGLADRATRGQNDSKATFSLEELGTVGGYGAGNQRRSDVVVVGSSDPESILLEIVRSDPFASIGELCETLNDRLGSSQVGWWWTFRTLRRKGLFTRRSRFRLARRDPHFGSSATPPGRLNP